jgi:hypothetical protein
VAALVMVAKSLVDMTWSAMVVSRSSVLGSQQNMM